MKVAILGTGNIGGTLGERLAAKNHEIVYGVRDPQSPKTQTALANVKGATAVSVAEAVAAAPIIFIALPWQAIPEALANAGDLTGKTLVDCSNRTVASDTGLSSLQEVAKLAEGAHVLKCFNIVAAEISSKPEFGSIKASMFFAGDDKADKAALTQLGEDIGYDMRDLGGLDKGFILDALFQTWIALAYGPGKVGRRLAFKVLTAKDDAQ